MTAARGALLWALRLSQELLWHLDDCGCRTATGSIVPQARVFPVSALPSGCGVP